MRIIYTVNDQKKGSFLSEFLASKGIENQLEILSNTDWGSPHYGDASCNIWIYDEDQVLIAEEWIEQFKANPENPIFQKKPFEAIPKIIPASLQNKKASIKLPNPSSPFRQERMGTLTFAFLILCIALFIITEMTAPPVTAFPASLPATPLFSSPAKKQLLYDYPYAFEILDKFVRLYGVDRLQTPPEIPVEGQYILEKFNTTPFWKGFYDQALEKFQQPDFSFSINAPLFEKIREGELWRLFTPCLLHYDIFHILFNMLWLIVLGKQIEQRLSMSRYFIFILIVGIFSNTCQYLMSGVNFIGFSGILCGMLTFIWMRQKTAPWEGYPLEKATFSFMMFFIGAMFFIQLTSFYLEINHKLSISPGIANTAHLSGAFIGIFLGCLPFFSRNKIIK